MEVTKPLTDPSQIAALQRYQYREADILSAIKPYSPVIVKCLHLQRTTKNIQTDCFGKRVQRGIEGSTVCDKVHSQS